MCRGDGRVAPGPGGVHPAWREDGPMKTRLLTAMAAAFLAAGTGFAQTASLPPINPIPVAPNGPAAGGDLPATTAHQDRPQVPPPPSLGPTANPPVPPPEQPCPDYAARTADRHVGPAERFWARVEYGSFWLGSARVPVLARDGSGAVVLGGQSQGY